MKNLRITLKTLYQYLYKFLHYDNIFRNFWQADTTKLLEKNTETFNNRKKKNIVKYILFQIFERIATERKRWNDYPEFKGLNQIRTIKKLPFANLSFEESACQHHDRFQYSITPLPVTEIPSPFPPPKIWFACFSVA